jgi:hypothetical protein
MKEIFWAVSLVLEILCGAISDRYGRRLTF